MAESSRPQALGGVALLWGLGLVIVFGAVFGPGEGLFFRDHLMAFRPQWWAVHTQIWDGVFPALDPTHPGGRPLEFSTGWALFTPATLVLLAGPFELTYDLFVISHFLVFGVGLFVFVRMLGGDAVSAGTTAAVASFSGPVLSFENLVVGLQGIAWSPWLWCALLFSLRRPGTCSTAALALALFLAVQGVMPELVLIDLCVLAGLFVLERPRPTWRLGAVWGGALLLGLAASTPDWVPLLEGLATARRGAGFVYEEASGWALSPIQALDLLLPSFWFSTEVLFFDLPAVLGRTPDLPYLISLYLGSGLLLALGAPYGRHRALLGLAAAGLLFLGIALGRHGPLHGALVQLPLFSSSRYAIKYLLGASLAVALLSGFALRELDRCARRLFVLSLSYLALVASVWFVVGSPEFLEFLRSEGRPFERLPAFDAFRSLDVASLVREVMRGRLLHAATMAVALAMVTGALVLGRLRPEAARWLVSAIVVVDLASAGRHAVPTTPTKELALAPPVRQALEGGGPRGRPWTVLGSIPPVVDVPGRSNHDDLVSHAAAYGTHAYEHLRLFQRDELEGMGLEGVYVRFHRAVEAAIEAERWDDVRRLWREAGVAYVVTKPVDPRPAWLEDMTRVVDHVDEDGRAIAVWRHDARPYVDVLTAWRQSVAPVSSSTIARHVQTGTQSSTSACAARVAAADVSWGRVEAQVELGCPGFVSVAEVGHPRWSAAVDGEAVAVERADAGYLAAAVPAGKHRVRFEYRSRALAWTPCMMAALLFVLGLALRSERPPGVERQGG